MNVNGNELRKGYVINFENKLWTCLSVEHRTPGNLRAFVQVKARNVKDGTQKDFRFSSTEKIERVSIIERKMQFLYADGSTYNFMDTENFEQIELSRETLGDNVNYLTPELVIGVTFYETTPIGIALPQTLDFEVVETDPEIKSATASASYKSATLSNGLQVQVPQFVKQGDTLRINTETGSYQERVKK